MPLWPRNCWLPPPSLPLRPMNPPWPRPQPITKDQPTQILLCPSGLGTVDYHHLRRRHRDLWTLHDHAPDLSLKINLPKSSSAPLASELLITTTSAAATATSEPSTTTPSTCQQTTSNAFWSHENCKCLILRSHILKMILYIKSFKRLLLKIAVIKLKHIL